VDDTLVTTPHFDGIVLAGGRARRLGGADKALVRLAGATLLDRALGALRDARRVVVVGPRRQVAAADGLRWTREQPPGGGPAAALRAGLREASAPLVAVLGVDTPLVDRRLVCSLVDAVGDRDAAMLVDAQGRLQPLIGAYRRDALAAAGDAESMHGLVRGLRVHRIDDRSGASLDLDTWDDLAAITRRTTAPN
jgi:molybdopterin-guanine dinucleotide biosynthesis protein A